MNKSQKQIVKLLELGKSIKEISEEIGISYEAAKKRVSRVKKKFNMTVDTSKNDKFETDFSEDKGVIRSSSVYLKTVDDVLNYADIDLDKWEVDRIKTNSWMVGRKEKKVDLKWKDGVCNGEVQDTGKFHRETLWQITVFLKKKVPNTLKEVFDSITKEIKDLPEYKLPQPVIKETPLNKHLMEISLVDHHFGKRCVNGEGLEDSKKYYLNAVKNLLDKASYYNVSKIVLPLGSDFFHIDNRSNSTERGTGQDVDGHLFNIYKTGCESVLEAIDLMRQVAPVDILWVPGNHDFTTSFFLCEYVKAYFHNVEDVTVDTSLNPRKYYKFGSNLIGYTHKGKNETLARLIMSENIDNLSGVRFMEVHKGHFHRKDQMNYVAGNELGNIRIKTLPSLSGTDYWHYENSFVGSKRAAEAFIYDYSFGNISKFNCFIDEIV